MREGPLSERTSETTDESINPIDCEEITDVNYAKSMGDIKHNRIPGFDEFASGFPKNVNRPNLLMGGKKVMGPQTHFKVRNLFYSQQSIQKLKSGGGITIRSPILEWGENGMSIGALCDAWGILTNGASSAQI